jgi:F420-non-reducing hydrogenase large subunit
MAFRAYDPCFGCATHYAVGEMPMSVSIYDHNKTLVKVVER